MGKHIHHFIGRVDAVVCNENQRTTVSDLADASVTCVHQINVKYVGSCSPEFSCQLPVVSYTCAGLDGDTHSFFVQGTDNVAKGICVVQQVLSAVRINHRLLPAVCINLIDDVFAEFTCGGNICFGGGSSKVQTNDNV